MPAIRVTHHEHGLTCQHDATTGGGERGWRYVGFHEIGTDLQANGSICPNRTMCSDAACGVSENGAIHR